MRNGLFGMILTGISLPSFAFNNPNIEFINQVSCKMGGCTMVCVSADGKKEVKAKGINSAEIITYKSGTVQHNLVVGFQKILVTSPVGTESCSLNNIDKLEQQ